MVELQVRASAIASPSDESKNGRRKKEKKRKKQEECDENREKSKGRRRNKKVPKANNTNAVFFRFSTNNVTTAHTIHTHESTKTIRVGGG